MFFLRTKNMLFSKRQNFKMPDTVTFKLLNKGNENSLKSRHEAMVKFSLSAISINVCFAGWKIWAGIWSNALL